MLFILAFTLTIYSTAQTPPKKGTASIAGRVLLKGEPVAGIPLALQLQSPNTFADLRYSEAKTEADGRFHFNDVGAGKYWLSVLAPWLVLSGGSPKGKGLNIAEGEHLENLELLLNRGGVISGHASESTGKPVADTPVRLLKQNERGRFDPFNVTIPNEWFRTDDHGLYRLYGLPPGKYKIWVGHLARKSQDLPSLMRTYYLQTFYPDATDEAQAKIIEIGEGTEVTDVNIKSGEAQKTYDVTGRVVDAETGLPAAKARLSYLFRNNDVMEAAEAAKGVTTDASGEFEFPAMLPGEYIAFLDHRLIQSEFYGDLHRFQISNNTSGLEIKARRGSSISGQVVIDSTANSATLNGFQQVRLEFYLGLKLPAMEGISSGITKYGRLSLATDGRFRIVGLKPESVYLQKSLPEGWSLLRIEHDGKQVRWFDLKPNEHLTNVRIVLGYGTAVLKGQVKIVGGTLPEKLGVHIRLQHTSNSSFYETASPNGQGQFVFKNLVAGEYELTTEASISNGKEATKVTEEIKRFFPLLKKTVLIQVGSSGEVQSTITIDLSQKENSR